MATAEQIKTLIKSHLAGQAEQFYTVALQVAAHEARQGHESLALEIRALVDAAKVRSSREAAISPELTNLVVRSEPKDRLGQIVLSDALRERMKRILLEFRQQTKLKDHGLSHRRKILLTGPPGTGKTLTASVLAGELGLPLNTILMERLVTKFMGETSAKLRLVFDVIARQRAVYLFDEFDAIGGDRSRNNDVGEMRRVLNSFLQFIERDQSDSLIIAASNNMALLDQALFRRFDDVLHYDLPGENDIMNLLKNRLGSFSARKTSLTTAIRAAKGLSHAEIVYACDDAIKEAILADKNVVAMSALRKTLEHRHGAYRRPKEKQ